MSDSRTNNNEEVSKPCIKVSMMVWNEFSNDARVLKEALTLQAPERHVTVHALRYEQAMPSKEFIATNAVAKRVLGYKPKYVKHGRSFARALIKLMTQVKSMACMTFQVYRAKPSIIHAHDFEVLPAAWLVSKLLKIPLVYDAHEISTCREGFQALRNQIGWIEKRLLPQASAVITTTSMRAKFFARAYGVKRPLVLQNRPHYFSLKPSTRIRDELMLSHDWPIVLYQGGLQDGRGLENLIRVSRLIESVYFVFIGSGRLESTLKQMVSELGISSRVKFIPTVALSDLPLYTSSADIGVQPILNTCLNHYTTDSNKLFEYVLSGLPVVATDFPEIRKIVSRYELGLLTDGTIRGMSDAIKQLTDDPKLRGKYIANAKKCRSLLSWESQEHKLLKLYELLVENHCR